MRGFNGAPTCLFSNGHYTGIHYPASLFPGRDWWLSNYNIPPNALGIGALGNAGEGGKWGNTKLPVDLGPFGAPNCRWSVKMDYVIPLNADALGWARWPRIRIPTDPAIEGSVFYDQGMWLDARANALGIVTSFSGKWRIGTSSLPKGAMISRLFDDKNSPIGFIRAGYSGIMRFVY